MLGLFCPRNTSLLPRIRLRLPKKHASVDACVCAYLKRASCAYLIRVCAYLIRASAYLIRVCAYVIRASAYVKRVRQTRSPVRLGAEELVRSRFYCILLTYSFLFYSCFIVFYSFVCLFTSVCLLFTSVCAYVYFIHTHTHIHIHTFVY